MVLNNYSLFSLSLSLFLKGGKSESDEKAKSQWSTLISPIHRQMT